MKTNILEDKHSEANMCLAVEFQQTISSIGRKEYMSDSSSSYGESTSSFYPSVEIDKFPENDSVSTLKSDSTSNKSMFTFIIILVSITIILIISMFLFSGNSNKSSTGSGGNKGKRVRLNLEKQLPLFLDIPGDGASYIPFVLSECLGLNYARIKNIQEISKESYKDNTSEKIDFLTTNYPYVACEIPNLNVQPFLLMQNPLLRVVASYEERRNTSSHLFDKRVANIKFEDYLRTYKHDQNLITKSILCKQSNDLSLNDFEAAKKILKNKYTVGIFNYYSDSIKLFQNKHNWKPKFSNFTNCIEKHSKDSIRSYHEMFKKNSNSHFQDILVSNSYDIKLYLEALNEISTLSKIKSFYY